MPLVGVFLHDRGIGADEIALFGFVAALLSFVSRSAFAILADRIGFHRLVLAALGTCVTALRVSHIPVLHSRILTSNSQIIRSTNLCMYITTYSMYICLALNKLRSK